MRGQNSHRRFLIAVACGTALLACLGPVAAGPLVLTPQVSVSEEYDDNVFFTGTPQDDFITSFSTGLGLHYSTPRLDASLSGRTSAQLFAEHTKENQAASAQSGVLAVGYTATPRLSISVSDAVARVNRTRSGELSSDGQAPPPNLEQPGPESQASVLLPRGEALSNFFAATARYRIDPLWTAAFRYGNSLSDFSSPSGRDLSNRVGMALSYQWTPRLSLDGFYNYARINPSNGTDTESHAAGLGAAYQLGTTWSVSGSAGVYVNRPLASNSDSISRRTGGTFSLALSKAFENSAASLSASQAVTASAGVAGVSETRSVLFHYNIQLMERLDGYIGASFADFNTSRSEFRVYSVSTGLNYAVLPYLSIRLSYGHRRREADQPVPGLIEDPVVDANLVRLTITASSEVWRGHL